MKSVCLNTVIFVLSDAEACPAVGHKGAYAQAESNQGGTCAPSKYVLDEI